MIYVYVYESICICVEYMYDMVCKQRVYTLCDTHAHTYPHTQDTDTFTHTYTHTHTHTVNICLPIYMCMFIDVYNVLLKWEMVQSAPTVTLHV